MSIHKDSFKQLSISRDRRAEPHMNRGDAMEDIITCVGKMSGFKDSIQSLLK